jgi:hypothetical protein
MPLAFHVNYWDRLGWKNPFGAARNSRRQYECSKIGATSAVYTPGFLLNGREWRRRRRSGWLSPEGLTGQSLDVELDASIVSVSYALAAKTLAINIALLGFGLETPVGAGENHSKTLREDFVVLGWDFFTLEYGRAACRCLRRKPSDAPWWCGLVNPEIRNPSRQLAGGCR